ncbi:MAG: DUF4396 domain-containing protein [Caulobacteraceae bacterium]|nr:DUF4396 domain-containing protein [Caulobacter sp.]
MTPHFPPSLVLAASASLALALACAAFIAVDEVRRPQRMWIMNLVWPLTALFGSVIWLAFYLAWGRGLTRDQARRMQAEADATGRSMDDLMPQPPFPVAVATGASHCGAGCALGDLVAEWLAFLAPAVALAFGWRTLFADKMFAVWGLDFLLAFGLGIAFQYYTIAPMRGLSPGKGLIAALKADFFSITAWQVGMYGFMAFAQLVWLPRAFGGRAEVDTPVFWMVMQVAMLCGFATSYPVNWLLIRLGLKERM